MLYLKPNKLRGEIFNAGTNNPYKIKDIVKTVYRLEKEHNLLKKTLKKISKNKTSGEILIQYMDYVKLKNFFNWKPKYSFRAGLEETIDWYKKYFKFNDNSN